MTEYSMTKYAYIVREKDSTKAFSSFDKALAYVSPLNYKAGMCIRFQMEDEEIYRIVEFGKSVNGFVQK